MKARVIGITFSLAFALTGALLLAGCGGETKFYYSHEIPGHCEINYMGQAWDDDGTYVMQGDTLNFDIQIEDGYYSEDFKLLINETQVEPNDIVTGTYDGMSIAHCYTYAFTPTEDFTIKVTGNFQKVVKQLTMKKSEWYDGAAANNSKLYIRFSENSFGFPTEETGYADFVKNKLDTNFATNMEFGKSFSFDVYYKGDIFFGDPAVADGPAVSCENVLYHENNEIGYHFTFTQWYEATELSFDNFSGTRTMYIITSENSSMQNSLESEKLFITFPEEGSQTLTITICNYSSVSQDVLSALKLKINGENQNIDFTSGEGTFAVTLKNPWEYGEASGNCVSYEIDLNFYEISYFDGIIDIPDFS